MNGNVNKSEGNLMKNQTYIILIALLVFIAIVLAVRVYIPKGQSDQGINKIQDKKILISQYQLQEQYGWKDIILWNESKENFEKAYTTQLNWMNYAMGFQRDSTCSDPYGGGGEWSYEKICFHFVLRADLPKMLDEMSLQSKGKILVVIGSIHDNNQKFSGNVYWCE